MNRRIKILLLLGAIIMAAGFIVCIAGAVVANVNGDSLFAGEMEGGKGYTYTFDGESITKIDIEATDVTVNIIGASAESKIELINFNENMYAFNCEKRYITFKESPDIKSMLNFFENGVTFKGMRYILRLGANDGDKIINIYLTDADTVNNFAISIGKGKISVSDIKTDSGYKFTVEDGTVSLSNVSTSSDISVSAANSNDLDLIFNNVKANDLAVTAATADLQSTALSFTSGKLNITHGTAQLDFIPTGEYFKMSVNANGKRTVNEVTYNQNFTVEKLPEASGTVTGEETETAAVPEITVEGRELYVYLSGDCFNEFVEETNEVQ